MLLWVGHEQRIGGATLLEGLAVAVAIGLGVIAGSVLHKAISQAGLTFREERCRSEPSTPISPKNCVSDTNAQILSLIWTLRISSGINEGICKWQVPPRQSDGIHCFF